MKLIAKALIIAMLGTSVTFTSGIVVSGAAVAAPKSYCRAFAERKANRKAEKRLFTGAAFGIGLGLITGAVVGGRHALTRGAIFGGLGGTAFGGVNASNKWRKNYRQAYAYCRNEL
jgi:hypothetical protein